MKIFKALSLFETLGWVSRPAEEGPIIEKNNDESGIFGRIRISDLPDEQCLRISCYFYNDGFSNIYDKIIYGSPQFDRAGAPCRRVLSTTQIRRYFHDITQSHIVEADRVLSEWWEKQSVSTEIAAKAQSYSEKGNSAAYHLAALAFLGDYNTLADYQQLFRDGHRMQFPPYISQEMMDRAVSIAIDRADFNDFTGYIPYE